MKCVEYTFKYLTWCNAFRKKKDINFSPKIERQISSLIKSSSIPMENHGKSIPKGSSPPRPIDFRI